MAKPLCPALVQLGILAALIVPVVLDAVVIGKLLAAFSELSQSGGANPELLAERVSDTTRLSLASLGCMVLVSIIVVGCAKRLPEPDRWFAISAGAALAFWILIAGLKIWTGGVLGGLLLCALVVLVWTRLFPSKTK